MDAASGPATGPFSPETIRPLIVDGQQVGNVTILAGVHPMEWATSAFLPETLLAISPLLVWNAGGFNRTASGAIELAPAKRPTWVWYNPPWTAPGTVAVSTPEFKAAIDRVIESKLYPSICGSILDQGRSPIEFFRCQKSKAAGFTRARKGTGAGAAPTADSYVRLLADLCVTPPARDLPIETLVRLVRMSVHQLPSLFTADSITRLARRLAAVRGLRGFSRYWCPYMKTPVLNTVSYTDVAVICQRLGVEVRVGTPKLAMIAKLDDYIAENRGLRLPDSIFERVDVMARTARVCCCQGCTERIAALSKFIANWDRVRRGNHPELPWTKARSLATGKMHARHVNRTGIRLPHAYERPPADLFVNRTYSNEWWKLAKAISWAQFSREEPAVVEHFEILIATWTLSRNQGTVEVATGSEDDAEEELEMSVDANGDYVPRFVP